ncbi:MAG: hypothetical protein SGBAC_007362 [Bacillariaceae sp.]
MPETTLTATATATATANNVPFRLAYITDVEGNLDYFLQFVDACPILKVQCHYRTQATTTATTITTAATTTTATTTVDDSPESNANLLSMNLDFCQPTRTKTTAESMGDFYFVFGGDSVDKGNGDIRLTRCLVAFKKKYPDRVFLLVGNRDLNKLRFTAELSPAELQRELHTIPGPHWDPSAPTLKEYLQEIADGLPPQQQPVDLQSLHTRVNKLKYMLKHTLGCPKTFEFRRQELSILQGCPTTAITDEQVVDNFIYEVQEEEGGSLHGYFQHAQVAVIIGNTLFCHGAVDKDTMQFVPSPHSKFENPASKPDPWKIVPQVHKWVDALNEFYQLGLQDFAKRPYWSNDHGDSNSSRGGESLMALQNRPAMWGRSIVSNCYGDGGCITTKHAAEHRQDPKRLANQKVNPLCFEKVCSDPMDAAVSSWLLKDGIQRVVVGHKPTGDCPAVLSSLTGGGVEIVSADTSFSDTSAEDNRGMATAVVQLIGSSSTSNQLHLSGILQNGKRYSCAFGRLNISKEDEDEHEDLASTTTSTSTTSTTELNEMGKQLEADLFLGRQLKDGDWWVKVKTVEEDEELYCLTRGAGRKVEYKFIPTSSLAEEDMR